jgi:hypothetical protein
MAEPSITHAQRWLDAYDREAGSLNTVVEWAHEEGGATIGLTTGVLRALVNLATQAEFARTLRLGRPSAAADPAVHTPERIAAYLTARGWSQRRDIPWLWDRDGNPTKESVHVHQEPSASDYAKRVGLLAQDLASVYETGELQVLADIEAAEVPDGAV